MHLAQRYPASRFTGLDMLDDAIDAANAEARERGLTNVRFAQRDVATLNGDGPYDLVTTFDAVHDQAKPDKVLAGVHHVLKDGGVYLCQEIKAETPHAANMDHPLAPFLYSISCMHCMSVSLHYGGPGLGAAWGRQQVRDYLADAGFRDVQMNELPHDPMNDFWVCRK